MSGLLLLWHRDGAPVPREHLARLARPLGHRGPDGLALETLGPVSTAPASTAPASTAPVFAPDSVGMACHHAWTTPEAVGERQPLRTASGALSLLWDGRLDNREEILALLLGEGTGEGAGLSPAASDARLVLALLERSLNRRDDPAEALGRLLGPFALAAYDARHRRVLAARDLLGDRTLCWWQGSWQGRETLLLASEEAALLRHPGVSREPDATFLASHYAVAPPPPGATAFTAIRQLAPGELLVWSETGEPVRGRHRRLRAAPPEPVGARSDGAWAEALLETLTAAVTCRLRAPGAEAERPAVLMSGGLDSTSVACLAASLASSSGPAGPRLVSWVFDELAACDERRYMDAVVERWGLESLRFPADGLWPLRGWGEPALEPASASLSTPLDNPYRQIKQTAYGRAAAAGSRVLLTGGFGDHLYTGGERWIAERFAAGRWGAGVAGAASGLLAHGLREPGVRWLLGRGLDRVPGGRRLRPLAEAGDAAAPWLTSQARERLAGVEAPPPFGDLVPRDASGELAQPHRPSRSPHRLSQWNNLLGGAAAASVTAEIPWAARAGVELRHPYRDLRMVELFLTMPADQLLRSGRYKEVLRRALVGRLPEEIRRRKGPTSLFPLYRRGLVEREGETLRRVLGLRGEPGRGREPVSRGTVSPPEAGAAGMPLWLGHVRREGLEHALGRLARSRDGREAVLPWQCLSAERWWRALQGDPAL